jgi:pantoate--beta-alanine ligase
MDVAASIDEVRRLVRRAKDAGKTVGLVPTMGALHAGHFSLIDAAKAAGKTVGLVPTMGALHAGHFGLIDAAKGAGCGYVVVSIYVNPTQFGPGEDLKTYPRSPGEDLAGCEWHGADLVFMPADEVMYPPGAGLTQVTVGRLTEGLCGRSRPGHFAGVCTVVTKLFNIVQPDKAFFGAKDFQQAAVIRRMAADLDVPVQIVVCPTVREADGLAMSSRNRRLSRDHRLQARALSESLHLAMQAIRREHPPAARTIEMIRRHLAERAPDGRIDYVQIVDPETLADVVTTDRPVLIALAVKFGEVRLIDNVLVERA